MGSMAEPMEEPAPEQAVERWLRELAELSEEIATISRRFTAEHDRLERRATLLIEPLEARRAKTLGQLHHYHALVRAADPSAKTIHMANGTLRSSEAQPSIDVSDEEAFVAWAAEQAPHLLRTPEPTTVPDRATIRAAFKETGKVVDGRVVIDGEIIPGLFGAMGGEWKDGCHWKVDTDG